MLEKERLIKEGIQTILNSSGRINLYAERNYNIVIDYLFNNKYTIKDLVNKYNICEKDVQKIIHKTVISLSRYISYTFNPKVRKELSQYLENLNFNLCLKEIHND